RGHATTRSDRMAPAAAASVPAYRSLARPSPLCPPSCGTAADSTSSTVRGWPHSALPTRRTYDDATPPRSSVGQLELRFRLSLYRVVCMDERAQCRSRNAARSCNTSDSDLDRSGALASRRFWRYPELPAPECRRSVQTHVRAHTAKPPSADRVWPRPRCNYSHRAWLRTAALAMRCRCAGHKPESSSLPNRRTSSRPPCTPAVTQHRASSANADTTRRRENIDTHPGSAAGILPTTVAKSDDGAAVVARGWWQSRVATVPESSPWQGMLFAGITP